MISLTPFKLLFFLAVFAVLVHNSAQQAFFEDAVKLEKVAPEYDTSLLSNAEEYDVPDVGTGPLVQQDDVPASERDFESENSQEQEDEVADRRGGDSFPDDRDDETKFAQAAPVFNEEEDNEDGDDDDKVPYNEEENEIEENADKRSDLKNFEKLADKSGKEIKSKKLESNKKDEAQILSHKNYEIKMPLRTENKTNAEVETVAKVSGTKDDKEEKSKGKKDVDISGSGSGEGSTGMEDESSGEETSGAERERRQTYQTEEQLIKAQEKLANAQKASEALTNIEKEMGLDPAVAPKKTKNLTSALHSEINKFKDMIAMQHDDVKKSKFQKLEKLAEEDVKGANDVMRLIVELEVAKFFAKHRARKKLELALRNKITNPPSQPYQAPMAPGFFGMEPNQYQGAMDDFIPQDQDQDFNAANPYAPLADQPQPQQAPINPLPSPPQAPFQPAPFQPAPFQPAPFQPAPLQNPLQVQYYDSIGPSRWSPQIASFAPPLQAPKQYNPYMTSPMNYAPVNVMPQPNPQPQQQQPSPVNPLIFNPAHKVVKVAPKHKITEKKPPQPPKPNVMEHQDDKSELNPQTKFHQDDHLPKSSPFSGLKPLQPLSSYHPRPFQSHNPSFNTEMQSQKSPFSSYNQNLFAASSSHPFSDALNPPLPHQNTQAFYPQTSWASPPPQVNQFSDSLSHLNPRYQKPVFKVAGPKPVLKANQRPHPPDLAKMLKELVRYRSHPISAHQFRPRPVVQPQPPQQLRESGPPAVQTPPMYSQFDFPGQPEPAIQTQQPPPQFNPPSPQYFKPAPQMSFMGPQPALPAPLPIQEHAPPVQSSNEQNDNDREEDDEDFNPVDQQFNDDQEQQQQPIGLQYQGPAVYPQQPQPIPQAYNGYNTWPNPGVPSNSENFYWPQIPNPQPYGYQPAPSYEQIVNPLLTEALAKVHDTQKAAKVVQKIENTIGLSPPAVNHIIDDVEKETKEEKMQFDQAIKNEQDELQKEKKLINDDNNSPNKEELKKKIKEKKKKLDEDRKRDEIAKTKLATIKKIERILTIIESAKYSALKRAKAHLMKLKTEKDPQIRKRDLEALERDLNKSEANHLHRRNEINIWLKGSRNNINTSHFLEGKRKEKEKDKKKNFNVFGSPSVPKLAIARFSTRMAKKDNINTAPPSSVHTPSESRKRKTIKKPKIGIVLLRKLLQRMDDLYDMQSKILTQLIKDHQKVKDEKSHERTRRNIRWKHRNHLRSHRHHHHHHRHHHSK